MMCGDVGAVTGRLGIDEVTPAAGCGRYPSKAVVGESIPITAVVWREGHDALGATVVWQKFDGNGASQQFRMVPDGIGTDRWATSVVADDEGLWTFRVDAWSDPWSTWLHVIQAKVNAGQDAVELGNDLESGALLLERVGRRPAQRPNRELLFASAQALRERLHPVPERIALALSEQVRDLMYSRPIRELLTRGRTQQVWVDRRRALYSSWYEIFPRSTGGRDETGRAVHGTFVTASKQLDRIAEMGFDVVYLPPIHPIGEVNRKGRNNHVNAQPGDVGSPWAIGSREGGHDAIHPELGTLEDFDEFVTKVRELGMEVALDLALQTAPDHPWVTSHPEWFTTRPDGTIAYAENPPKRYQDIYPINFDNDPTGLYAEVLRVCEHWISHGVRIFRVDNPHTKPPNFWHWLIWQLKAKHSDVLFLAEAFTRPARLYGLARLGYTQSYTYFTWRTNKQEIIDFAAELAANADEARPNLFVNTPDILHESLQVGGRGMFAIRAALAATMSPSWGVYSGFELYEDQAVRPGSEEYLNSEKYELRPRDFEGALTKGNSLQPWLTRLNEIRKAHPALQQLRDIHFHHVDNDALIAFSKTDPVSGDTVICVITLDPANPQQGTVWLDLPTLGLDWSDEFGVHDRVTDGRYLWRQANFVRLEPWQTVCHIFHITK
jgi:starch synthase (maltosyl-transferring)